MKMASSFCYHSFLTLLVLIFSVYMPIGTMCLKMKLIPRVDIDPILFPKNISEEEKLNRLVQLSKNHALKKPNTITTQSNFQPMLQSYGTSFFLVEMMIGSPIPYQPLLLLDTGSDDTWVQCDKCGDCFPIQYGNFKFRESQTVNLVSCDDPLCVPKKCSQNNKCLYEINYLDGASTRGIVLSENFTFPDPSNSEDDNPFTSLIPVVFGCGLVNQNMNFGGPMDNSNIVGGIFGLGTGPRSFLSQFSPETNMRFFYCLSSQKTQPQLPEPHSFMYFGNDQAKISGDFKTTPLLTKLGDDKLTNYYADCTGISLSGTMLSIPRETFELKPGRKGGFLFDSGSYVSFLTKTAYEVLEQNVIDYFEQKGFHRYTGPSRSFFDLCYINVPNDVVKPSMSYHFAGDAEFEVDPNSLFVSVDNLICLSVVSLEDEDAPNIMGARHQQNHAFLFDAQNNQISFSPKAISCSDYQKN